MHGRMSDNVILSLTYFHDKIRPPPPLSGREGRGDEGFQAPRQAPCQRVRMTMTHFKPQWRHPSAQVRDCYRSNKIHNKSSRIRCTLLLSAYPLLCAVSYRAVASLPSHPLRILVSSGGYPGAVPFSPSRVWLTVCSARYSVQVPQPLPHALHAFALTAV